MKVILFGATGMVGAGTLRELLADPEVEAVLSVGRRPCGVEHPKLEDLVVADLFDVVPAERLAGWDACIWAVGVSSVGLDEAEYARLTVDLTLAWARPFLAANPDASFCYCSGAGAGGKAMWARVRQQVEGALLAMPFRHVACVRPGMIRPAKGIRSRVALYQVFNTALTPLWPVLVRGLPSVATTSEVLGRAMLRVVKGQADRPILESADINRLGA